MGIQFDAFGREIPDPRPVEIPAGMKRPESLTEIVQRLVRNQLSQRAAEEGNETWEEANDFDMDDEDPDGILTPYELHEMQEDRPIRNMEPSEPIQTGSGMGSPPAASAAPVPSGEG